MFTAALVVPLFAGDSQKAYVGMTSDNALDYDELKAEILRYLRVKTLVRYI